MGGLAGAGMGLWIGLAGGIPLLLVGRKKK